MKKKITLAIVAAFSAASFQLAAAQQPKRVPQIGYLSSSDPATESTRAEAIRLALRELGYIEGQNIAIEYRYAEGNAIGSLSLRPSWCVSRLISSW
jgi:putative ABC transport system substrate-binding protein